MLLKLYRLLDALESNKFLIDQNRIIAWNKKKGYIFQELQNHMGTISVEYIDQEDVSL